MSPKNPHTHSHRHTPIMSAPPPLHSKSKIIIITIKVKKIPSTMENGADEPNKEGLVRGKGKLFNCIM